MISCSTRALSWTSLAGSSELYISLHQASEAMCPKPKEVGLDDALGASDGGHLGGH